MVIPHSEVIKIVKNLGLRDLENPEGASVDLRLGSVHKITGGKAFIEVDGKEGQGRRSGFETEEIYKYREDDLAQDLFTINPGDYFLIKTVESVDVPLDVMGDFRPRSTLFRSGLLLLAGIAAPGYKGELIFGLKNEGPEPVSIQMGARVCQAIFYRLESEGIAYRGQNQGGRVTASGEEQQV